MSVNLTLPTITAQELKLPAVDPISLTVGIVFESAPVITGVPTISGVAKVGQTLTATAASSSGVPTPIDSFQWQRSDNGTTGWADISGATNTTYTAVTADENKYLRVVQTSTNVAGSDTANSASTAQVASAFTGLLDTYSGAKAAYSLRLLRSKYSGSAIRVRRSDDNEEQDIGFRNNELDTSTLETFSLGSDCFVTVWYDQSDNETPNNATQSTAANQPKIVSSGTTITENSKPAIQFDGSNDKLTAVSNWTTGNSTSLHILTVNNVSIRVLLGSYYNAIFYNEKMVAYDGTSWNESTNAVSLGQNLLEYTYYNSGGNIKYYNNGVSNGSSTISGSQQINNNIGSFTPTNSAYSFDGKYQELIHYDSDQSSNRSGIETNINDYYSIYE